MKICIVGAGAIGGYLAVKLALTGNKVTTIARGEQLRAIRSKGLTLHEDGKTYHSNEIEAHEKISEAGKFDLVILCVKAQQIAPIVNDLNSLFDENTVLLTTQNGIPWWYFQHYPKQDSEYKDYVIESVDPGGIISKAIDPKRIIGCVVYPAVSVAEPGVIEHNEGNRFPMGELDGSESERIKNITNAFIAAGLKSPILPDIRGEIWLKVWGSCCFNPLSALTGGMLSDICTYPSSKQLVEKVMLEAYDIATKLGITFRVGLEKRINGAAVLHHKTSMLQDIEAKRSTELDSLVTAVIELGALTKTPTPRLETIHACVKLLTFKLGINQ